MKNHKCGDKTSTNFKCNQCGKMFVSKPNLELHTETVDCLRKTTARRKASNHTGYCQECDKQFTSGRKLQDHKRMVHSSQNPCLECEKCFLTLTHLELHKDASHRLPTLCNICGKSFKNIIRHQQKMHTKEDKAKKFVCHLCEKDFQNSSALSQHKAIFHEEKKLYSNCNEMFS